jgi:hypothetical protein
VPALRDVFPNILDFLSILVFLLQPSFDRSLEKKNGGKNVLGQRSNSLPFPVYYVTLPESSFKKRKYFFPLR